MDVDPGSWLSTLPLVLFSHQVVSASLRSHGLQHTRLLCLSLSPRVCSNSCPSSQWCYSTISVTLFSSCPQGFPASGLFPVGQHFASGGQSIGVSTSASVLSTNIQDWFLLGLTGLISLPSKVENPQCDLREVVPFRQSLHSGIGSLPLCGLQRGFLTRVSAFKPPPEPLCGHMARMAFL